MLPVSVNAVEALAGLLMDGMTIAVGGFGLSGNPTTSSKPYGTAASDSVHTPGVYVHRLVQCVPREKDIEQRTVRPRPEDLQPEGLQSA